MLNDTNLIFCYSDEQVSVFMITKFSSSVRVLTVSGKYGMKIAEIYILVKKSKANKVQLKVIYYKRLLD